MVLCFINVMRTLNVLINTIVLHLVTLHVIAGRFFIAVSEYDVAAFLL